MIGNLFILLGAVLTLIAAIGVVRLPGVLARMHAQSKATTLGYACVCLGAAINLTTANDITTALLAGALQILTVPVGVNLIGRATHLAEGTDQVDGVDELAEARRRGRSGSDPV